jgi:hypothetical protein
MESLYFILAGIILYFGSDWMLRRMEAAADRRFKYRSFIFFAILLTLALVSFALIRNYAGNPV